MARNASAEDMYLPQGMRRQSPLWSRRPSQTCLGTLTTSLVRYAIGVWHICQRNDWTCCMSVCCRMCEGAVLRSPWDIFLCLCAARF